MKRFILYIFICFVLSLLFLEITVRMFGLVGDNKPKELINNNVLLSPNASGIWVKGGLAEIKSKFKINKQGFNSLIDYDVTNKDALKIAIVGDSFIEGFHTDVDFSIGRQLEDILSQKSVVHEYGIAGANIKDYVLIYNQMLEKKKYDFIFILLGDEDFSSKEASIMSKNNNFKLNSSKLKLYDKLKFINYLNTNHGLQSKTVSLLKNGPESFDRIHKKKSNKGSINYNYDAILELPKEVVILYDQSFLSDTVIKSFNYNFKKIVHSKLPKDNGFDEHWNKNGRFNCAKSIADYISRHPIDIK